jgi:plasmid stabilization system protein ParE
MAKLVLTGNGRTDLLRLRDFLATRNQSAAARAVQAIRSGLKTLRIAPEAGKPVDWLPEGYREWFISFGKSGYVVLYRLLEDHVVIQAVRHGRESDYRSR